MRWSPNFQFMQPLGTWSMHVESWVSRPNFPVHVMRYEDMLQCPFDTFKAATQVIGLDVTDIQIQKALDTTQFDKLQQKELTTGFKEKAYFRSDPGSEKSPDVKFDIK